ncbi:hypothetical protein J2785_005321 [Burkholderia ambifaria]|nr:hypothetical protein [Burkholderia ambifaria]
MDIEGLGDYDERAEVMNDETVGAAHEPSRAEQAVAVNQRFMQQVVFAHCVEENEWRLLGKRTRSSANNFRGRDRPGRGID